MRLLADACNKLLTRRFRRVPTDGGMAVPMSSDQSQSQPMISSTSQFHGTGTAVKSLSLPEIE